MPEIQFRADRQAIRRGSPSSRTSNLTVEDGEFLVLLGPSGCGKTTLLNLLAGLLDVTAGPITIDGRDVTDLDPKDRGLAMVFQSYALYPTKTVRGNLKFGLVGAAASTRAESRAAHRVGGEAAAHRAAARPQAVAAVGRPTPARRHRPGAGQEGRRVPVRRAALQSRRQAAHRDAARDQEAPQRAQADRRLRHARPDRGDDHGDADRHHGSRRHPADRLARRGLRDAGQSVRRASSSARRR